MEHSELTTVSIMTLIKKSLCHYAECRYAECRVLFIFMLNVDMPSVIMLNVIMLSVIILNVAATESFMKFGPGLIAIMRFFFVTDNEVK